MLFQTEAIRPGLWRIWDVSHTAFYLVEGQNAAALIDSGVGVGSVRDVVMGLTDKPVSVWITHGHVDHAMGASEFDEIHMDPADLPVFAAHSDMTMRQGYVAGAAMAGADPTAVAGVRATDFLPPPEAERLLPLSDGERVDLGGIHLRFYKLEGHTTGSMTVLLEEWRILILGDACNAFTYLFDPSCPTVEQYRENLLRFRERTDGSYDRLLFSHGTGEGDAAMIGNVIRVCEDVLAGHSDAVPFRGPFGDSAVIAKEMDFVRFCRVDGGEGNIVYNTGKVRNN